MYAIIFDGNSYITTRIQMNRLEKIISNDTEWGTKIKDFMDVFPEFLKFQEISPLESGRLSSRNENRLNLLEPNKGFEEPVSIFETIIYYVAASGVRFSYAISQWIKLKQFINKSDWNKNCTELWHFLNDNNIQPAKKDVYWNIISWMVIHSITKDTITMDNVYRMKHEIKGLGVGFEAFMKSKFTDLDNFCSYTDISFKKGFTKVYGPSTDTEIKKKSKLFIEMGFGRVADRFMFQICHYASKIGL